VLVCSKTFASISFSILPIPCMFGSMCIPCMFGSILQIPCMFGSMCIPCMFGSCVSHVCLVQYFRSHVCLVLVYPMYFWFHVYPMYVWFNTSDPMYVWFNTSDPMYVWFLIFFLQAWVRITSEILQALDTQRYVVFSQLPGAHCASNR